jgi:ribosomal protein L37AE/L43A
MTSNEKPVKDFRLTDKTMIANCPNCGKSWCGQSYYEQYKAYYDNQEISPTDKELWEIIKERHANTHSSLLFHIVEAGKYVCPFCASVFEKE